MTVQELQFKLSMLIEEGKGDREVYIYDDYHVDFEPVTEVDEDLIENGIYLS